ncbi:RecT family recombinase [Clostridium perfringens]|uniref:RecT family recombinase n=1 Tax=Clostridium perfringens TaxID=1502 RepID=UPI000D714BFD|nr:RecT family recombinase [Clostridium perfringens]KAB8119288.1 recombinase RecT [Clostridium perfringens]PWX12696.1 recombinase [Clostridium perfringens]PWX36164.1 recombinase [Clostridium perfringens]PWX48444.1 recombinase [Clostridium perfringens]PWX55791.1 recombinase [Clostridium perfringens]
MSNTTALTVIKKTDSIFTTLIKKEDKALPAGFNPLRFKQNALTVLMDTKGIDKMQGQEYNLARTLMKGAYLGLDFFNKECYCIIYGGKPEFQTDYKGEIKLAKKYSINPIKDIYAKLVKEGDEFQEEIICGQQSINFKPKPFNNGNIIGAFAVCFFKDGSMMYETMSKEEIEDVRKNYSKMPNGPSWTKSTGEMYKKTVLRRLCKLIELDFDNIEQVQAFEEGSGITFEDANKKSEPKEKSVFEIEEDVKDVEYEEVNEQEDMFGGSPFEEEESNGDK